MSEITQPEDKMDIDATNETIVTEHLHDLISKMAKMPSLLKGPVRILKIQQHDRQPRVSTINNRKPRRISSKITLEGDWIDETGISCTQKVKIIPLERLLIIIPEENEKLDR